MTMLNLLLRVSKLITNKKRSVGWITFIVGILPYLSFAQDLPVAYQLPDSFFNAGKAPCGNTPEYINSLGITPPTGMEMIIPGSFPSSATDTCGKFVVYYEDMATASTGGFNAGGGIGANRRLILCEVLSYIQSVYDFSGITSGQYIRLQVAASYHAGSPAPAGTKSVVWGGSYYDLFSGIRPGYVLRFIHTGTDPKPGYYHGQLKVNFDKTYPTSTAKTIDYFESLGTGIDNCQTDLYSTLLHGVTHSIGWFSKVNITNTALPTGTVLSLAADTIFTLLDTAIHSMAIPHLASNPFSTLAPVVSGGSLAITLFPDKTFWINNRYPPYNHHLSNLPGYMLGHFADYTGNYCTFARCSPGESQDYVMAPYTIEGVLRRNYTKGEWETMHRTLGYAYAPGFSAHIGNSVPFSEKMASDIYNTLYEDGDRFHNFQEVLPSDLTMTNNIGDSLVINLWEDSDLVDYDGDSIKVLPSSIVNYRGCGDGNNHALLTLTNNNKTIVYKPRRNFYGRAQFGFLLTDGKETGGRQLYTINVVRGTNVYALPTEELVVNGDCEQGTELKQKGAEETIGNSISDINYLRESRLGGVSFFDAQPLSFLGCYPVTANSHMACDSTTVLKHGFGLPYFSYPGEFPGGPGTVRYPLSPTPGSEHYLHLPLYYTAFFYLADTLSVCKKYVLELDINRMLDPAAYLDPKGFLKIGFTDSSKVDFAKTGFFTTDAWTRYRYPTLNDSLDPMIEIPVSFDWQHLRIPFTYCGASGSHILTIKSSEEYAWPIDVLIDNISIKEDTSRLAVKIKDDLMSPCANHRLAARDTSASEYNCMGYKTLNYYWTSGGDTLSTDSVFFPSPTVTTLYKVTVYDGCHTASDSATVLGSGLIATVSDTAVCKGESAMLSATVTGATGSISYLWSPSTGLSCTSCPDPLVSSDTSITYTLTVTDALGCFKRDVRFTVHPLPLTNVSNDTAICLGQSATLIAKGIDDHAWSSSPSLSCTLCDTTIASPTSTTDYYVNYTSSFGCSATDTVRVTVNPLPAISITASPSSVCGTDPVILTASGGIDYTWHGSPWIACVPCASTPVNPPHDETFRVAVRNMYNCMAIDSIRIKVRPKPMVSAIAPSTVCQYSSASVSGAGASTYTWATLSGTTTGIACPTCPATSIVVMAPTYYVVTGTDTNGCSNKDTFLINVHSLPTVTVSPASVTICGTDSATLTAGGALSYTWSPTTGISCSTCNPVKVRPLTSPRTYVVTGTDANGCTNTASSVITTAGACACSPVDVFGTSATTLSGTFSGTFGAGYYYIPDNITITGSTTFTDAKVLIGKDVTVTVDNNAVLTIDHSHWFTCPDSNMMWQGIVLASGVSSSGRIEVRNNSLIEDAVMAIYANNPRTPGSGHIIRATSSVFNRNQLDISVHNYNPSTSTTYPFSVLGSVFTARAFDTVSGYPDNWPTVSALRTKLTVNSAKDAYRLSRSYPRAMCKDGLMKYMGLRFEYVGATTGGGATFYETAIGGGNSTDSTNLFDNHKYGIFANRSNMTVRNSVFINMSKRYEPSTQPSSVLPDWGGLGIFARSDGAYHNRLRLTASGGNLTNHFHDCFEAIGSENVSQLDISSAVITTSHRAGETAPGAAYPWEIYTGKAMWIMAGTNYKQYSITSNSISNVNCGIHLYMLNPPAGAVADLNNNNFYAKNPDPAYSAYTGRQYIAQGIEAYCGGWGAANTLNINGNSMSMVWNGILFSDMHTPKTTVNANTITLWDTLVAGITSGGQYAIRTNYSQQATISGNTLYTGTLGPIGTADRMRGVYAVANTDLRVCGNSSTNIGRAFEFAGPYAQTGTRWIGNTMSHAYKGMVLGTDIGDQGGMYNFVTMTPTYFWGATKNVWSGGVWGGGPSRYQTIGVHPTSTMFSKLWVSNIPSGGSVERPTVNETTPLGMPPPYLYNYSSTSGSILISNAQWDANCQGGINPTVVIRDPAVGTHGGPRPLGGLILVDGLGYDEEFKVNQWMAQLSLYERATLMPDLRDSSATLDSFMTVAADSRFGWLTAIEQALAAGDTALAETLLDNPVPAMDTLRVNGNILLTDYPEADAIVGNYEQYYRTYLRFMRETMDASDTAAIADLAYRCPDLEGAVVYKARSLYSLMRDTMIIYQDDSCRYGGGQQRRVKGGAITGGEAVGGAYTLYPNPNTGSFTLTALRDKQVTTAGIKVYSALGALVHQSLCTFNKGKVTLDIGEQAAGLYLLCIEDGTGTVTCLRFVIQ